MKKYPRTYHFPFSLGTTNDDKITKTFDYVLNEDAIYTEKLDGENIMLAREGVFSRSRSGPTDNPWNAYLKPMWSTISSKLGDLEVYGESMYAVHSIEYSGLKSYFYIFGIRDRSKEMWLSWDEVVDYSYLLDLPTVPLLLEAPSGAIKESKRLESFVKDLMTQPSELSDKRFWVTPKEGIVVRVRREFHDDEFDKCLFKFVRENHVSTDQHWSRKWKRAHLKQDLERILNK